MARPSESQLANVSNYEAVKVFYTKLTATTGAFVGMEERTDTWGAPTDIPEINDELFEVFMSARIFDRYDKVKFVDDNAKVKFVAEGATELFA